MRFITTVWVQGEQIPYQTFKLDTFDIEPMAEILSVDPINHTVKMKDYYYHFIGKYQYALEDGFTEEENYWYTTNLNITSPKMAYSIYIKDPTLDSMFSFPCDSVNLLYDPLASMEELLQIDKFHLYPNPTSSVLNVQFKSSDKAEIWLMDIGGKLLQKQSINSGQENLEIQVSQLNSGLYFIHFVENGTILETKKWIKK